MAPVGLASPQWAAQICPRTGQCEYVACGRVCNTGEACCQRNGGAGTGDRLLLWVLGGVREVQHT